MTDNGRLACNLGTGDNSDAVSLSSILIQLYGVVQIRENTCIGSLATDNVAVCGLHILGNITCKEVHHLALIRTILHVLGNGNNVQTVVPSLLNTELRRYTTVRKDCVVVQIGLVDIEATYLRQNHLHALTALAIVETQHILICRIGVIELCRGRERSSQSHCQSKKFFHCFIVLSIRFVLTKIVFFCKISSCC